MFTMPRPNVIESDEGFSVEVLGQTGIKYTEGPKEIIIDSEVLTGPSGICVYKDTIESWSDPENGVIGEEKKYKILNNIQRAFKYKGFEIEVI